MRCPKIRPAGEWPALRLPGFRRGVKANVVSHDRAAQLMGALKHPFVRDVIGVVLLRRQDIDLPKTQLSGNGVIHVDIEIESDGHEAPSIK